MKLYSMVSDYRGGYTLASVEARETKKMYIFRERTAVAYYKNRLNKDCMELEGVSTTPEGAIEMAIDKLTKKITARERNIVAYKEQIKSLKELAVSEGLNETPLAD